MTSAQISEAYRLFYGEGLTLGEVAERLGCGLYDLSPWLYSRAARAEWERNNPPRSMEPSPD